MRERERERERTKMYYFVQFCSTLPVVLCCEQSFLDCVEFSRFLVSLMAAGPNLTFTTSTVVIFFDSSRITWLEMGKATRSFLQT